MNRCLLDTDIFSELSKAKDPHVARNATAYLAVHGRFTISSVTLMKSIRGLRKKQATRQLQVVLAAAGQQEILPFDRACAELAGTIAGELERTGQAIGVADTMIASIALVHDLELTTGNHRHFQRVVQLGLPLVLVDWRS